MDCCPHNFTLHPYGFNCQDFKKYHFQKMNLVKLGILRQMFGRKRNIIQNEVSLLKTAKKRVDCNYFSKLNTTFRGTGRQKGELK